jgi:hypothetical protein
MKQKIPTGVVVAILVIVVVGVLYFGWYTISGGPNGDVTQESIKHYQAMVAQARAHKPTSPQEAARSGAPIMGGPPPGSAPMGRPPAGAPPPGGGGQ